MESQLGTPADNFNLQQGCHFDEVRGEISLVKQISPIVEITGKNISRSSGRKYFMILNKNGVNVSIHAVLQDKTDIISYSVF